MTVWITKYALTKGIQKDDSFEICTEISSSNMIHSKQLGISFHKPHWHLTKEEALAKARSMRHNKIASLNAQITNLISLEFR